MAGNFATKVNDLLPEVKVDGKYVTIEDVTKFTLPNIQFGDGAMTGAGLLGEINIPDLYNISAVEHSISSRSLRNITKSLGPAGAEFRLAWAMENLSAAGSLGIFDSYLATVKGRAKEIPGPDVEKGSELAPTITYSDWYYKLTRNGETIVEIDMINGIININGTDYAAPLRAALGL